MSLLTRADAVLREIGAGLALPLAFGDDGVAVLDFGADATGWLTVSEPISAITLRVPLLQQFGDQNDRLAVAALRMNLTRQGPPSGRVGMVPDDGEYVYRADLHEEPTVENLVVFLETGMRAALDARAQLRAIAQEDPVDDAGPDLHRAEFQLRL